MRDAMVEVMDLEFWLLGFYPPGAEPITAGVVVFGPNRCQVFVRLRRDWASLISAEDAEVMDQYEQLLIDIAVDNGAAGFATLLEDTFSNSVRIDHQGRIDCEDPRNALARLYQRYIERPGTRALPLSEL